MGSIENSVASSVVWREEENYEEARVGRVFNHRRPDRYPRGVVQPTSVQEVSDAVKLARDLKIRVSIRSGGHSWAAWSVREDALLIDMKKMPIRLELNEDMTIIKAAPAATGRELNGFLATKGKMFAGGHCPDVGIGGFLLQGGMGWNCKNWGWACEKVSAIEVVTSTGDILLCDRTQNSDLFYAARGAGPGFPAIVTSFHLELRNSFSAMKSSIFLWPLSEYKTVMDWTVKVSKQCDDSIEAVAVSILPDPNKEAVVMANFVTFQNTEEAAIASLKLVNDTHPPGTIMEDMNKATSLQSEYDAQDLANPKGHRYTSENCYVDNDADVTEVLREAFTTMPAGTRTFSLYYAMAPTSRRPLDEMALSMQSDHYFASYTVWQDAKDDERCKKWVKDVMSRMEKHSVGAYLGDSDFQIRKTKYWNDPQAKKLMDIRRKWDPQGVICGYLDAGDKSGVNGLENEHEW